MGVDYSASAGYGIKLDSQVDDIAQLAVAAGYVPWGYEDLPEEEWDIDDYEAVDYLAKKYGLAYVTVGNSYSGEEVWIIGEVMSWSMYDAVQSDELRVFKIGDNTEIAQTVEQMRRDLNLSSDHVGYWGGMHVY